jgi:hypothetical protein
MHHAPGENPFMSDRHQKRLLIAGYSEKSDDVESGVSGLSEMIQAAEDVLRAARESGGVNAERVLQAVLELLETARGGKTPTAQRTP